MPLETFSVGFTIEIVTNVKEVDSLLHATFNLENNKGQRTTSSTKIPHLIITYRSV